MSEWQSIETAPKNGTRILIPIMRHAPAEKRYAPIVVIGKWKANSKAYPEGMWVGEGRLYPNENPTHWMPLPEPPK